MSDLVYNCVKSDDDEILYIDVPGAKKDDVTITINDVTISIRIEYESPVRGKVSFTRSFYHRNVDVSNITAKLEDGILKVVIPRIKHPIHTVKID